MGIFSDIKTGFKKATESVVDSVVNYFDEDEDKSVSFQEVVRKGAEIFSPFKRQEEAVQQLQQTGKEVSLKNILRTQATVAPSEVQGLPISARVASKAVEEFVLKPAARAGATAVLSAVPSKKIEATPFTGSIFGEGYTGEKPGEVFSIQEQVKRASGGQGIAGEITQWLSKKTGAQPGVFAVPLIGLVTVMDLFPENPLKVTKALKEAELLNRLGARYGDEAVQIAEALSKGQRVENVRPELLDAVVQEIKNVTGETPDVKNLTTKIDSGERTIIETGDLVNTTGRTVGKLPEEVARKPIKTGEEVLDEFKNRIVYGRKTPDEPISLRERLASSARGTREALINQYTELDRLQAQVLRSAGQPKPTLLLSEIAEQYAGVAGKQQLDLIRFKEEVVDQIKDSYKEFNEYLAMRRTLSRIETGKKEAKVAGYGKDEVVAALKAMRQQVGEEKFARIERAATALQGQAQKGLDYLTQSGVLSKETADRIAKSSNFYAKFDVIQSIEKELSESLKANRGLNIRESDLLKRLKGIEDEGFRLFDPTASTAAQVAKLRAVGEKNMILKKIADLAQFDKEGNWIKKIKKGEKIPAGASTFEVFENGVKTKYLVNEDVARALKGMNAVQMDVVSRMLALGAKPFRFGAITANTAFQIVNLFFADIPRNFLMNKFVGINPANWIRFVGDYLNAFYSSATLTLNRPNQLARDFLESGAANSTIARVLSPESFVTLETQGRLRRLASKPMTALARAGDFVETSSKIAGFLPGKRAAVRGETTMAEVVKEVRNYAGSPDFARRGSKTKSMNLLFMFFNARLQGVAADMKRLGDIKSSAGQQAWIKLAGGVAIPATTLMLFNLREENRSDYEKIPLWERDNYFMIPKSLAYGIEDRRSYFTNQDGEVVRDYWKIPKREIVKLTANIIEDAVKMYVDKDPKGALETATEFIEGISPVNIEGNTMLERELSVIGSMNPLIKTPIEMATLTDTFTKREILPEYISGVKVSDLMLTHPEKVYKESTPEAYIWMADQLRTTSPLIIQHALESLTGGLAKTFFPEQGKEEGTREAAGRVEARFQRSPYLETSPKEQELLDKANQIRSDYAAGKLDAKQTAKEIFKQMESATSEEAIVALLGSMSNDVKKELTKVIEAEALGYSYIDSKIKNLPSNRSKAEFIFLNMQSFKDEQEANEFFQEMDRVGIWTDGVKKELKTIIQEQAQ